MTQITSHPAMLPESGIAELAKRRGWLLFFIGLTAVLACGVYVARRRYYTPGSDFGYYLGLTGALMMLTLLLFPLRKRWRVMQGWGKLANWFRVHMILGVAGPLLILFHSTFSIGSINAGVALISMLLVAGSGVIGRFVYTKIHHGLYGSRASLKEMQIHFNTQLADVKTKLHFAPHVEDRLREFEQYALAPSFSIGARTWRFLTIGLKARWVRSQCARELKRILAQHAAERHWDRDKLRRRLDTAIELAASYLDDAKSVAQFTTYEKIFSLWHVLHIPLVYMLVFSAIFHVIAVHMY